MDLSKVKEELTGKFGANHSNVINEEILNQVNMIRSSNTFLDKRGSASLTKTKVNPADIEHRVSQRILQ